MRTPDEIVNWLEDQGERLTIQRRVVIEALTACGDHMTIQDIHAYLNQTQGMALSETTIYRILEWLKRLRIVAQTDMGAAGIVYALIDNPLHHHLICLRCGRVIDIDDAYFASMRRQLKADLGFITRIDHMAIYGECEQCAGHHDGETD